MINGELILFQFDKYKHLLCNKYSNIIGKDICKKEIIIILLIIYLIKERTNTKLNDLLINKGFTNEMNGI